MNKNINYSISFTYHISHITRNKRRMQFIFKNSLALLLALCVNNAMTPTAQDDHDDGTITASTIVMNLFIVMPGILLSLFSY